MYCIRKETEKLFKTQDFTITDSTGGQNDDITTCQAASGKTHCTFMKKVRMKKASNVLVLF